MVRNGTGSKDFSGLYDRYLRHCTLCPRKCRADRINGETGLCGMGIQARIARASLHLWEEPCISGDTGSGTVFFTGCSLGCIYCQNAQIAFPEDGRYPGTEVTPQRLAEIFLELQGKGAANINLVTAGHFAVPVLEALTTAKRKQQPLQIPVVFNTSGFELPSTLRLLGPETDIYLTDFRYWEAETAKRCSHAEQYPLIAKEALKTMTELADPPVFDEQGMMRRGVIVRVLLLPGHVKEACRIVDYLYGTYEDSIYISLLSQYTPMPAVRSDPLLGRCVTAREYERLVDHAVSIGVVNGFWQDGKTAMESFIPDFTGGEGVIRT